MKFALNLLSVLLFLAGCGSQPVNRMSDQPLAAVDEVSTERYLGRWYEIARLPNRFEKNCEAVTADYSMRDDGLISVVNTCRLGKPSGKVKVAKGRARIVDQKTRAKLEVSFFGPFWGDYWVIHLEPDYSVSVVGEPSGRYLWVLARTPVIDDMKKAELMQRLTAFGYDVNALYYPMQPPPPDVPRP